MRSQGWVSLFLFMEVGKEGGSGVPSREMLVRAKEAGAGERLRR